MVWKALGTIYLSHPTGGATETGGVVIVEPGTYQIDDYSVSPDLLLVWAGATPVWVTDRWGIARRLGSTP